MIECQMIFFLMFFLKGLDPAKPGFEDTSTKDDSLDPSDADFVDVIHTCGGTLGYAKPLGHMYVLY